MRKLSSSARTCYPGSNSRKLRSHFPPSKAAISWLRRVRRANLSHPTIAAQFKEISRAVQLFNSFARLPDPDDQSCWDTWNDEAYMNTSDLEFMLRCQGIAVSPAKTEELYRRVDANGDGMIHLDEFLAALDWLLKEPLTEDDMEAVFHMLDSNGTGEITADELKSIMTTTKGGMSQAEAEEIMKGGDQNLSGGLNFEEFRRFMSLDSSRTLVYKLRSAYRVIFVCGGPGSGKGTICSRLVQNRKELRLVHISCGDLLRKEVEEGTVLGLHVKNTMETGGLVDASVVQTLLDKYLANSAGKMVLLDGFPRSLQNAEDFLEGFGQAEGVMFIECPDEEMVRRIVARGVTSGRSDDNENTAWERIRQFHKNSIEPLHWLIERGCKVISKVDSTKDLQTNIDEILSLPVFRIPKLVKQGC